MDVILKIILVMDFLNRFFLLFIVAICLAWAIKNLWRSKTTSAENSSAIVAVPKKMGRPDESEEGISSWELGYRDGWNACRVMWMHHNQIVEQKKQRTGEDE